MSKHNKHKKPERISVTSNKDIRYPEVRVIGPDGEQLGVMQTRQAQYEAQSHDLDLVLVTDKADVPVCRIVDMGKFLYEKKQTQKAAERKQRQNKVELKEVQFRPNIDNHDFETKCKHVARFVSKGALVKVLVMFRGRERSNTKVGFEIIDRVVETVGNVVFDSKPQLNGNRIIAILKQE